MINNFEIKNYKCFKDFKVEGLSQINIISGKNNVGKTALLESIYLMQNYKWEALELFSLEVLWDIAQNRDIDKKGFINFLKNINFCSIVNDIFVSIEAKHIYQLDKKEKKYMKSFNEDYFNLLVIKINDSFDIYPIDKIDKYISNFLDNYIYINSSKSNYKKIANLYSNIQSSGIQHKFLNYLQILDKNIVWIEPQLLDEKVYLRINLENPKQSFLSSELGEGTNRYIEILGTILAGSIDTIFIDEIENGIHYSKLKDIWKAIIEIVQKENIQLFVTTHDKETIEALNEASKELEYENITSIKLKKDKNNIIYPVIRKSSLFNTTIDCGMDIR